jgi:hypothetical protein
MKFAAPIATMALAASTLAFSARAEDMYTTLYTPSRLQILATEALIPISPKVTPSEDEVRPDMRPIIGIDLTWREQEYFRQYMCGRSMEEPSSPLMSNTETYAFNFHVAPTSSQNVYRYESSTLPIVPAPSALALAGLGALAAARRMRR